MNWVQIETTCNRTFTEIERFEIHACFLTFERCLNRHRNAASPGILAKLWEGIESDIDSILSTARRVKYNMDDAQRGLLAHEPEWEKAWNYLCMERPGLTAAFGRLEKEARLISDQMEQGWQSRDETRYRAAKTEALEEFVRAVYANADHTQSGSWPSKTFKRERWGVKIGQASRTWHIFVNAVLDEEFSRNIIRDASKAVINQM